VERLRTLVRKSGEQARIALDDLFRRWKKKGFNTENAEDTESTESTEKTRALTKRMVRRIVESIKPRQGQLGAGHVEAVLQLARGGQSGSSLSLPGGVEVRRERDALVFLAVENAGTRTSQNAPREYDYKIDSVREDAEVSVAELGCAFRFRVIDWPPKRGETSRDGAVLDRDRLRFPLALRNWRPGDRLHPQGRRGAHKLKRLLNEKRVSRWERDGWPVLTSGGVLAWARGFPVAAEFAVNERTQAGIVIAEEKI
jgi:tRNA(Ile)-lysidine synthase